MNRRLLTLLLCAFVISAGASYIAYRLIGKQLGNLSRTKPTLIVVAARDLEIGTLVKASDVRTGELVGEPPKDILLKAQNVVGRGVVSPIYAGEPVNDKRLARVGSGAGLASTIPPGMRACAVKVDDVMGVAGFAIPGTHVDVLISGNAGGANPGETRVRTLLQNIVVLSAGQNFQKDDEGKPVAVPVVNLLVTPEQAELLSLASSNQTRIQLVLRNPIDHETAIAPGSGLSTLFGHPETKPAVPVFRNTAPAAVAPPPQLPRPVFVVQVLNGGKHTEQTFELQANPR